MTKTQRKNIVEDLRKLSDKLTSEDTKVLRNSSIHSKEFYEINTQYGSTLSRAFVNNIIRQVNQCK